MQLNVFLRACASVCSVAYACLTAFLSFCSTLFVCLPACLSVCLSVRLSICLSVCLVILSPPVVGLDVPGHHKLQKRREDKSKRGGGKWSNRSNWWGDGKVSEKPKEKQQNLRKTKKNIRTCSETSGKTSRADQHYRTGQDRQDLIGYGRDRQGGTGQLTPTSQIKKNNRNF